MERTMKEQTIFPREEHADVLFQKILADPWACDKLFETFCNDLFSNDELEDSLAFGLCHLAPYELHIQFQYINGHVIEHVKG